MLLRTPGPRGHMLIEAMVGGAVLAITITSVFSNFTQNSSQVSRALRSQNALEIAQAQYDRLRERPIDHTSWQLPVPANQFVPCPDTQPPASATPDSILLPNTRWACRVLITRQVDTFTGNPVLVSPGAFRTARIEVSHTPSDGSPPILVTLELTKCERC